MIRYDLRESNQIRPMSCELGVISEAAGSARFSIGLTSVLARVYGPSAPKYLRHENFEKASIEIELSLTTSNNMVGSNSSVTAINKREKVMIQYLHSVLEQAIQTELFPRLLILFQLDIIHDDGSLLSTSLNACILAALDSGIPMRITPISVTLGLLKPSAVLAYTDGRSVSEASILSIDPCYEEEQETRCDALFVITFTSSASVVSDSVTTSPSPSPSPNPNLGSKNDLNTSVKHTVLRSKCTGVFQSTQLLDAMRIGAGAADTLKSFFRELLMEKHS